MSQLIEHRFRRDLHFVLFGRDTYTDNSFDHANHSNNITGGIATADEHHTRERPKQTHPSSPRSYSIADAGTGM
eukprot:scaffold663386_cov60-Prasinocladus_malaysianus.AAC.1